MYKRKPNKNKTKRTKFKKHWIPRGKATVTSLIAKGHEPKCACCGSIEKLTFDHVLPKSKGGPDTTENGQILCFRCNNKKANRRITLKALRIEIEAAENLKSRQYLKRKK